MKATDINGKYVPIASLEDLKTFGGKDVTIYRMVERAGQRQCRDEFLRSGRYQVRSSRSLS